MDYKWAQELGLIRKPAAFISTISDERGQELLYAGMRISDVFKEDIENCLKAGMNDHIGKPIDPDNLFKKLDQYLPEITSSETVVD